MLKRSVKKLAPRKSRLVLAVALTSILAACAVTPEPLSEAARDERLRNDLEIIRATRFVPEKPISLYEAMARAVSFNLEHRVREVEAEIAEAELEQANYKLLPAFDTRAGTDVQNRETSDSADRNQKSASAGLSWNILDLGVSYARAKQQSNQVLIAAERRRKAFNDILRDVRLAFWRATSAGSLLRGASALSGQIQNAVNFSADLQASKERDAKESIVYRRALLDGVRNVVAFRREIGDAKSKLAELLNIPPGVEFELVEPTATYAIPSVPMSLDDMERHALLNRAEIRIEDYQKRADSWRMREQLFELLPGIDLSSGANYSSDSFLLNNTFWASGIQIGMNLFNLFAIPGRLEAKENAETLADIRRLAMAIAVMAQVHISYREYQEAMYQFALTRRIGDADRSLAALEGQRSQMIKGGFLEFTEAAVREMKTAFEEHRAFVDLIRAHNELMHAVGANDLPDSSKASDIAAVAANLEHAYSDWDRPTDMANGLAEVSLGALIETALPSVVPPLAKQTVNRDHPSVEVATDNTEIPVVDRLPVSASTEGSESEMGEFDLQGLEQPRPVQRQEMPLSVFNAQIGAYRDSVRADVMIDRLLRRHDLRKYSELIHREVVDSERQGRLHAARIGPFFTFLEAISACNQVKRQELDCIALKKAEHEAHYDVGSHY